MQHKTSNTHVFSMASEHQSWCLDAIYVYQKTQILTSLIDQWANFKTEDSNKN